MYAALETAADIRFGDAMTAVDDALCNSLYRLLLVLEAKEDKMHLISQRLRSMYKVYIRARSESRLNRKIYFLRQQFFYAQQH